MSDLRYPIGEFSYPGPLDAGRRRECIARIAAVPARLRASVAGLSDAQLDTPYRPGGWTARQVVHHLADSHMNSYVRFRLALTEPGPTIKPYDQTRWAELPDARSAPVEASLALLEGLHRRWVLLLEQFEAGDWSRGFYHPEQGREIPLDEMLAFYAWHGDHHTAHISSLSRRMGWTDRSAVPS